MQRGLAILISFLQEGAILRDKPLDDFKMAIIQPPNAEGYHRFISLFAKGIDPARQATGRFQAGLKSRLMQRSSPLLYPLFVKASDPVRQATGQLQDGLWKLPDAEGSRRIMTLFVKGSDPVDKPLDDFKLATKDR